MAQSSYLSSLSRRSHFQHEQSLKTSLLSWNEGVFPTVLKLEIRHFHFIPHKTYSSAIVENGIHSLFTMHMQQCRSTCGCQLAQRVSVRNNDMLFPTWVWLKTKLWGSRLYILYSWSFTKNSFLVYSTQRQSTLQNCMDKCKSHAFIYVMNTKLHPYYCQIFFPRKGNCWFALRSDCLMEQVFEYDRGIYYANYAFKSSRNAIPVLESAVITSTRTVFCWSK